MDWNGYEFYHPGVAAPLNTLSRAEAKKAFERLMTSKADRVQMLRRLLKANGVTLDDSDAGIQDLNDWFRADVQPDPTQPHRLLPEWYSVVNDIALFLGDVLIARHPQLRWEFFTWGAKNVAFQRHVIMGFSTEDPKFHTNLDIDAAVALYGHCIVAGQEVEHDAFWKWLRNAAQRA